MVNLFNKHKEFKMLLLEFLLITVGGLLIGYFLQRSSWSHQHRIDLMDRERIEAENVFKDISSLMDNRMYKMSRLYSGIIKKDKPDEREKKLEAYRGILDLWNSNLSKNLSLTDRYFGKQKKDELELKIHTSFVDCGKLIESLLENKPDQGTIKKIQNKFDYLKEKIYLFDIELLNAIKTNKIGVFINK